MFKEWPLSKFSPASSSSQVLRVLTALDYLFDPKRADIQTTLFRNAEALAARREEIILTTLYENSTFGPSGQLSDCLAAIRQRGNMA